MNKIEEILGTVKESNETWEDVFKRIDSGGGIDFKTITKIVVYILGELDERTNYTVTPANTITYNGDPISPTTGEYDLNSADAGTIETTTANNEVQAGSGVIEEEIQPELTDTSEPVLN